jgi:rhamnose utilization protein RhaD (predicted bifunctional aldolase and dehydrogenase)
MFGAKALFVPYTDPGYVLFKKVAEGIEKFSNEQGCEPQIIFLENHGVFVGADTTGEIEAIYAGIMQTIEAKLRRQLPGKGKTEFQSNIIDQIVSLHTGYTGFTAIGIRSDLTDQFVSGEEQFQKANKSFTPDDIVYCKAHYLYIPARENEFELLAKTREMIAAYFDQYGYLPKVLAVQNQGVIGVEESRKSAQNVLDVYENILKISFYAENFGGPKFLNDEQIAFIDNWEVENYRRKMAKS